MTGSVWDTLAPQQMRAGFTFDGGGRMAATPRWRAALLCGENNPPGRRRQVFPLMERQRRVAPVVLSQSQARGVAQFNSLSFPSGQ